MSKRYFVAAQCDAQQLHLLCCAICQLTNPFNGVYLASLAHHFKGITLSGKMKGLEKGDERKLYIRKRRRGRSTKRRIWVSIQYRVHSGHEAIHCRNRQNKRERIQCG